MLRITPRGKTNLADLLGVAPRTVRLGREGSVCLSYRSELARETKRRVCESEVWWPRREARPVPRFKRPVLIWLQLRGRRSGGTRTHNLPRMRRAHCIVVRRSERVGCRGWESKPSYLQLMRLVSYHLTTLQSKLERAARVSLACSVWKTDAWDARPCPREAGAAPENCALPCGLRNRCASVRTRAAKLETALGLAPSKIRVAAGRLDDFGMAVVNWVG